MPRTISALVLSSLLVIFGLAVAPPAQAQDVIITIKSVDTALADLRYLATCAGEDPKFLDEFVQKMTGGKGWTGVDTKAPLGVYADLPAKENDPPTGAIFIPITDQKQFLGLLKLLGLKVLETDLEDVYIIGIQAPDTGALLRFAHKHAFISANKGFLQTALPNPALLLPEGKKDSLVTASQRLGRLSQEQKKTLYEELEQIFKEGQAYLPRKSYSADLKQLVQARKQLDFFKSFFEENRELNLHLEVDPKQHVLALEAALVPYKNTPMVERFRYFATVKSSFSRLGQGAWVRLAGHIPLSEEFRLSTSLLSLEAMQGFASASDRALLRRMTKVLEPILTTDRLDFGAALYKDDLVAGLKIRNGRKVEHLLRDLVKDLSPADKADFSLKWNHSRIGKTRLHKLTVLSDPDSQTAAPLKTPSGPIFAFSALGPLQVLPALYLEAQTGRTDLYFCIHEEVLLLSSSPRLIQEALDSLTKPALDGPPLQLEITGHAIAAVAKEMAAMPETDKQQAMVGKILAAGFEKALKKADRDKVQVRLSLHGGASLRLRLEVSTDLLQIIPSLFEVGKLFK
jgi:hypothetical protein